MRQVQGSCCFSDTSVGVLIIRVILRPLQFNTNTKPKNMMKYLRFTGRGLQYCICIGWHSCCWTDVRANQPPATNHLANYFVHLDEQQQRFVMIICSSSLPMFCCQYNILLRPYLVRPPSDILSSLMWISRTLPIESLHTSCHSKPNTNQTRQQPTYTKQLKYTNKYYDFRYYQHSHLS